MKICGIFGYTDAGKTTFIEHLSHKSIQKYKLESKKGITLKVGYLNYITEKNDKVYILDNPGHLSLSIETLRNIDLIDFAIYVLDASTDFCIENQKTKLLLGHYSNMVSMFKTFNIPHVLVLNKIDLCDIENLKSIYTKIKLRSNVETIVPSCSLNETVMDEARLKIANFVSNLPSDSNKKEHLGVGRIIKSFDVNPVGVELKEVIGGILGVYFFKPLPKDQKILHHSNKTDKNWSVVNITNEKYQDESQKIKIGTLQTESDPFWFKNDSLKSSFLVTPEEISNFHLLEATFTIKLVKRLLNLNKGDQLLFIYEGQSFTGVIKKISKNTLDCIKKFPDQVVYKVSPDTPILLFTKNDMKEYSFSGTALFYEET